MMLVSDVEAPSQPSQVRYMRELADVGPRGTSTARFIRRAILGLSMEEASFGRRGFFLGAVATRLHLEQVGRAFLYGYNAGIEASYGDDLDARLADVQQGLRGFAFEGAAMALALLDRLTPWRQDRWAKFVLQEGAPHVYMAHVGAGWAFARAKWQAEIVPAWLDPLLRWLVLDGYGFHEGYFAPHRYVVGQVTPPVAAGYPRRAFDQGLGRSLWFSSCADAARLAADVGRFPAERHADLWSGIGLACAYAGGVARRTVQSVLLEAGTYAPQLAQGVAFAAKTRQRAGNPAACTALACEVICRTSSDRAAAVTDAALNGLPTDGDLPAYEVWRRRIAEQFAGAGRGPSR